MPDNTNQDAPVKKLSLLRRTLRWAKRVVLTMLAIIGCYLLIALVGLYPVNTDFQPAADGIEILIFSGEFHTDIILPLQNENHDWRPEFPLEHFNQDTSLATHIALGWGEENFYLHTPTWADLKVSTAAKALLIPSTTVMHVSMMLKPTGRTNIRSVKVTPDQYRKLVAQIQSSFARDDQVQVQQIAGHSYGDNDAFYKGVGSYHAFRTCNCWAGEVMQAGEIKVGWFTPFPKSVFMHLPPEQ